MSSSESGRFYIKHRSLRKLTSEGDTLQQNLNPSRIDHIRSNLMSPVNSIHFRTHRHGMYINTVFYNNRLTPCLWNDDVQ